MSDGLYVDNEELENTRSEVLELLNKFNDCSAEFNLKLGELRNNWDAADYQVMAESVKSQMEQLAGENGTIPTLMNDVARELEKKNSEYKDIQNSNIRSWR